MNALFFLTLLIILAVEFTSAAKVLFSAMADSASHRRSMYPLAEALAAKGHFVVMFAEIGRMDNARGKNLTDNLVLLEIPAEQYVQTEKTLNNLMWYKKSTLPLDIIFPWKMGVDMARRLFEEKFEAYKSMLDTKWDLIIVDAMFTVSGATLAMQSKIPYIIFDPSLLTPSEAISRSIPYPTITFPPMFMSTASFDIDRFMERVWATVSYGLDNAAFTIVDRLFYRPLVADVMPTASLWDFYGKAQGSLIDYPNALDYPRPTTPDLFYIGGKCKSASLLKSDSNSDLLEFVEDPKSYGTIVIAFGHMVKWRDAPVDAKREFAQALNKLDQYRIVWQFDGELSVEMKPHVRRMTWLPQTELLNHANTKLFVSHGGLKSIMESICGEVPAVVIPFFAEQIRNAYLFARQGAGEKLNKFELVTDNIYGTIVKVLNNANYKKAVKRLKWSIVEQAPVTPLANGIFWTEYMIRHKGLPQKWFKNKGIHIGWIRYFMLDVLGLFSFIIFSFVFTIIFVIKKCLKC